MKLYFLVEGSETEVAVYRAWIQNRFQRLQPIEYLGEAESNWFYIIGGFSTPPDSNDENNRLVNSFLDMMTHHVDHFFVCVDSEKKSYTSKMNELQHETNRAKKIAIEKGLQEGLSTDNLTSSIHLIVQHCCIETWFLGNQSYMPDVPKLTSIINLKSYYDVSVSDPELMDVPDKNSPYRRYEWRKNRFHRKYLEELFKENGKRYIKSRPEYVTELNYFHALQTRCQTTNHLRSLHHFFAILESLK